MFPCYVLASDFQADPKTGEVLFDNRIQFVAPTMPVEQQLAIFSDKPLAEEYLELCNPSLKLKLLEMARPQALRSLLLAVQRRFQNVVVDLNPKTRIGQTLPVAGLLMECEKWIAQLRDQDDRWKQTR